MELRVLRYFLTVVREESITRAAEMLHITQPTLSRQLSTLEEELGVKLMDRGGRRIALTDEGMLLRRRAEELVALADKTEQEFTRRSVALEGRISIGSGEIATVSALARCCEAFHAQYPLVTFDLLTASADAVKEQMDRGLLDIGLLLEPVDIDKYDYIRMAEREEWVVLMRPDAPLAEKRSVTAADLAGLPLIMPRRLSVQSEVVNWFGSDYSRLNVLFTSNLSTNASVMVGQGLGYAIVIGGSMPFCDERKIVCRPLSPALPASSVLAWRRQQPFSTAATKFIEFAKCFLSMHEPNDIGIGHAKHTAV